MKPVIPHPLDRPDDPREPFPYCDCGRVMRRGVCPECEDALTERNGKVEK